MSNIAITYSATGFQPSTTPANPGDTIQIINSEKNDISVSYSSTSTKNPLAGLTSPVTVPPDGGSVSGVVRVAASNHPLTLTVNDLSCTVNVGAAPFQLTATPTSLEPAILEVVPRDEVVFYNQSASDQVTLEFESAVPDPFGDKVGQKPVLEPLCQVHGHVQRAAAGTKVKVTVEHSTSTTSSIDVGSGDTDPTKRKS